MVEQAELGEGAVEVAVHSTQPMTPCSSSPSVRPDWPRILQLALAALWLLDGVLQLQPFFFKPGGQGFDRMLAQMGPGNPRWVAHSIAWNASVVDHHPLVGNGLFVCVQILLGLGIAWRPTVKAALGASVVWSLLVWWFGEGMGGVFRGAGSPIGGGPGAVLFYGLLAVLLWPANRTAMAPPFAAARAVGVVPAKWIWVGVWGLLALLLLTNNRSPQSVSSTISTVEPGEPSWLEVTDRHAASLASHEGFAIAIGLAVVFLVVASAVALPCAAERAILMLAIAVSIVIWVVGENFGMILPGSATDPNSGPLLVLLILSYWPLRPGPEGARDQRLAALQPALSVEAA